MLPCLCIFKRKNASLCKCILWTLSAVVRCTEEDEEERGGRVIPGVNMGGEAYGKQGAYE